MNVMRESLQSIQAYSKDKAFQLQDYQNIASITHAIPYATVAIGNPERHVRKASHRGSKQQ